MDEKNSALNVKDSRMFNADGSLRDSATTNADTAQKNPTPQQQPEPAKKNPPQPKPAEPKQAPAEEHADFKPSHGSIDFPTFILSLASSAQISMGIVPNPMTGSITKDLMHSKQTIDIIGMLEEKTRGNLSPEESGLLKQVLFQLRMQFVELNKSQK